MTREEAIKWMHKEVPAEILLERIYDDFEAKDKFKKCENCKHKDGESGGLTHCSYFEQFMPTEIGKCDIWDSKNAR